MRLKILFFPLVLVVSITIFASFIWPQLGKVRQLNSENLAKRTELGAITSKQEDINAANNKITGDSEGDLIVKEYVPTSKSEERIIAGVNYLANDANVVISNISLTDNGDGLSASTAAAMVADPVAASATPATPVDPSAIGQPVAVEKSVKIKTTSAKISVVGDYAKIRIFLDGLEHMPVINEIKSVDIKKQEVKNSPDQEAPVDNGTLAADIVVDFGHMDAAKVDTSSVTNFKSDFDTETVGVLKKYVSQKSQFVPNANDAKGKSNPFLAN